MQKKTFELIVGVTGGVATIASAIFVKTDK